MCLIFNTSNLGAKYFVVYFFETVPLDLTRIIHAKFIFTGVEEIAINRKTSMNTQFQDIFQTHLYISLECLGILLRLCMIILHLVENSK